MGKKRERMEFFVITQIKCNNHIEYSSVSDTAYCHHHHLQFHPNHCKQQRTHHVYDSQNIFHRIYVVFVCVLLISFNVKYIHCRPTSLSLKNDLNAISSSDSISSSTSYITTPLPSFSSTVSLSSIHMPSVSPPISINVKNKSLGVDDLLFHYLDFITMSLNHTNDIKITNVFMRSQRTKRSLSFYMSNLDRSPLFLAPLTQNYTNKRRYLSIHDNGTIKLTNSHRDISAMITVSVIVKWSASMNKEQLLMLLHPRNGSRLILRKFAKNICICMYPNGTVYAERIINQTITDNCEWRLRVSRYGIGFEHESFEGDSNSMSLESPESSLLKQTTGISRRYPTLNVADEESNALASGWTHWLWQPEATWQVYGVQPSLVKAYNKTYSNTPDYQRFISIHTENLNQFVTTADNSIHESNSQNSTSITSSRSTVKVGSQQVVILEAPAYYFRSLHDKENYKHCETLKTKLVHLVQTELVMSFITLDKYRQAFKNLSTIVQKFSLMNKSSSSNYDIINNKPLSSHSIAKLLDQWLMLLDYKWRQTTKQYYKMNSRVNNCSLSFKSSFEINAVGNDSDDKLLVKLHETRLKTKIYYSLFENLQHIIEWTDEQKYHWLQHPRIIKLFHYLHIKCPSLQKLRQASFILRQYLPTYSPEDIRSQNDFHYGLMGKLKTATLRQFLSNDTKMASILIDRAAHLKFEEYYFWPILKRVYNKAVVEHSIFLNSDLRNEIKQMSSNSMCYKLFMKNWKFYKKRDSTNSCLN
uniref:Uncharacterized protein n=1 Tax=Trichobilharzia regenti TaxID=157069 RepID=A0AA85JWL4_TRIRE|nr:unnamed protein product [Trichobilharzia regenti]